MSSSETTPSRKQPRIVLLEDEPLLADLFEMCIRDWFKSAEIVKLANGNAACQELSQTEPDMFIMDWSHPGLKGNEVLELLAARNVRCVILLTSDMFSSIISPIISRDFKVGYLPKPFGVLQFWHALNELIGPSDFPERQSLLVKQELR
jgi:CheY-like chemotaxis protein